MIKALSLLLLSVLTVKAGVGAGCSSVRYTPACMGECSQYCEIQWATNDGSGRIAGVPDFSGSGRPFIGGGTTHNPTWTNNSQNGRPSAMFQSANSGFFTNNIITFNNGIGNASNGYAVYIVKAASSSANVEVWTASGTTTNKQLGCDGGSLGIRIYDGSNTNTTGVADLSTKFTQVMLTLTNTGTFLQLTNVTTNGIVATITDQTHLINTIILGSFGRILTVYGDFYYCGSMICTTIPPISHQVLGEEYWRSSYHTY